MQENHLVYNGVKEIARRAGVSIATIDRVIHNRGGVAPKTLEKINQIIKELDFQPNLLASRLASKKIFHFATLIPQTSTETAYWDAPLRGIHRAQEELKQFGTKIHPFFYDLNDPRTFTRNAKEILKNSYDGLLLAPSFVAESNSLIQKCDKLKIPYLFINSDIENANNVCYIGPDLYQSGYLGARLIQFGLQKNDKILVVNISKNIDNYHHLKRKETGFISYFKEMSLPNEIISLDIQKTATLDVEKSLSKTLKLHPDIHAIFVTSSRVFEVAQYLVKSKNNHKTILVGFDFIKENIKFLSTGFIDFLICHKPEEASYKGIMTLYQNKLASSHMEKAQYMPIDIITRENAMYYSN